MEKEVIVLENISKTYRVRSRTNSFSTLLGNSEKRAFKALNDISFQVYRGDFFGVVGRNGSGKSTLLRIIAETVFPDKGGKLTISEKVTLLSVGAGLISGFTGRENIYYKSKLMGLSKKEIDRRLDSIIEFSELREFIDLPIKKYSSGMKSKLGFAISIHINAKILIVDEALAVGDSRFRKKCFDKITELVEQGTTILLVTHSDGAIVKYCNRACWIEKGELISIGNAKDIAQEYKDFMQAPELKKPIPYRLKEQNVVELKDGEEKANIQFHEQKLNVSREGEEMQNSENSKKYMDSDYIINLIENIREIQEEYTIVHEGIFRHYIYSGDGKTVAYTLEFSSTHANTHDLEDALCAYEYYPCTEYDEDIIPDEMHVKYKHYMQKGKTNTDHKNHGVIFYTEERNERGRPVAYYEYPKDTNFLEHKDKYARKLSINVKYKVVEESRYTLEGEVYYPESVFLFGTYEAYEPYRRYSENEENVRFIFKLNRNSEILYAYGSKNKGSISYFYVYEDGTLFGKHVDKIYSRTINLKVPANLPKYNQGIEYINEVEEIED